MKKLAFAVAVVGLLVLTASAQSTRMRNRAGSGTGARRGASVVDDEFTSSGGSSSDDPDEITSPTDGSDGQPADGNIPDPLQPIRDARRKTLDNVDKFIHEEIKPKYGLQFELFPAYLEGIDQDAANAELKKIEDTITQLQGQLKDVTDPARVLELFAQLEAAKAQWVEMKRQLRQTQINNLLATIRDSNKSEADRSKAIQDLKQIDNPASNNPNPQVPPQPESEPAPAPPAADPPQANAS